MLTPHISACYYGPGKIVVLIMRRNLQRQSRIGNRVLAGGLRGELLACRIRLGANLNTGLYGSVTCDHVASPNFEK